MTGTAAAGARDGGPVPAGRDRGALSAIGAGGATASLVPLIGDPDSRVRCFAAEALGWLRRPEEFAQLAAALVREADPFARGKVAGAVVGGRSYRAMSFSYAAPGPDDSGMLPRMKKLSRWHFGRLSFGLFWGMIFTIVVSLWGVCGFLTWARDEFASDPSRLRGVDVLGAAPAWFWAIAWFTTTLALVLLTIEGCYRRYSKEVDDHGCSMSATALAPRVDIDKGELEARIFLPFGPDELREKLKDETGSRTDAQREAFASIYIGKWMKLSGKLVDVGTRHPWYTIVTVSRSDDGAPWPGLWLGFDPAFHDQLQILDAGTAVELVGRVERADDRTIVLKRCELVPPSAPSVVAAGQRDAGSLALLDSFDLESECIGDEWHAAHRLGVEVPTFRRWLAEAREDGLVTDFGSSPGLSELGKETWRRRRALKAEREAQADARRLASGAGPPQAGGD